MDGHHFSYITKLKKKNPENTAYSFSTNFGGKLSFIPSFLSPERLQGCHIYFHDFYYLYNYYNYSRALCNKC
jgi:hypothetical protein